MKMENKLLSLDTPLFEGITQQDRRPMLDCITYHTAVFSKGEIIAFEQENMKHIGIVLSGSRRYDKGGSLGQQDTSGPYAEK